MSKIAYQSEDAANRWSTVVGRQWPGILHCHDCEHPIRFVVEVVVPAEEGRLCLCPRCARRLARDLLKATRGH